MQDCSSRARKKSKKLKKKNGEKAGKNWKSKIKRLSEEIITVKKKNKSKSIESEIGKR